MMYLINYRLHKPGKDYEGLYEAIKLVSGIHWHNTTSSWLLESNLSAHQIYDRISPYIDSNDELVVFKLQGDPYGQLRPDDWTWMNKRRF